MYVPENKYKLISHSYMKDGYLFVPNTDKDPMMGWAEVVKVLGNNDRNTAIKICRERELADVYKITKVDEWYRRNCKDFME